MGFPGGLTTDCQPIEWNETLFVRDKDYKGLSCPRSPQLWSRLKAAFALLHCLTTFCCTCHPDSPGVIHRVSGFRTQL